MDCRDGAWRRQKKGGVAPKTPLPSLVHVSQGIRTWHKSTKSTYNMRAMVRCVPETGNLEPTGRPLYAIDIVYSQKSSCTTEDSRSAVTCSNPQSSMLSRQVVAVASTVPLLLPVPILAHLVRPRLSLFKCQPILPTMAHRTHWPAKRADRIE